MKDLTEKQNKILSFIQSFRETTGYPPTLRQIGKHFGISSTFGVKRHLDALVKKGYLNIESYASRGISILKQQKISNLVLENDELYNSYRVPIVGRVAAGSPILAVENIEGNIIVDPSFMRKTEESFALKVKGDSMVDAGIFEGDIVIVTPQKEAITGDIVVALLADEATVKEIEIKNNKIRLIPQNKNYQPINVTEESDFSLVGKVTGVIRYLH
jgi:repressor LexA